MRLGKKTTAPREGGDSNPIKPELWNLSIKTSESQEWCSQNILLKTELRIETVITTPWLHTLKVWGLLKNGIHAGIYKKKQKQRSQRFLLLQICQRNIWQLRKPSIANNFPFPTFMPLGSTWYLLPLVQGDNYPQILLLKKNTSLLEYNCFTIPCSFCCTTKQISHMHTHVPISPPSWASLPPSLPHPKAPSQPPCAMLLLPTSQLFYIW